MSIYSASFSSLVYKALAKISLFFRIVVFFGKSSVEKCFSESTNAYEYLRRYFNSALLQNKRSHPFRSSRVASSIILQF
jgi:hypothetical protein